MPSEDTGYVSQTAQISCLGCFEVPPHQTAQNPNRRHAQQVRCC